MLPFLRDVIWPVSSAPARGAVGAEAANAEAASTEAATAVSKKSAEVDGH